jgi:predicted nucleotidyltransferase
MDYMELTRHKLLADSLDELLPVLIEAYDPEKVVLFGSMARGNVAEWSDLDLLIVKETDEPFLDRSVRVALLCRAMVGVDYLVYTPAELANMIERGNPFILQALGDGQVLYERRTDPSLA